MRAERRSATIECAGNGRGRLRAAGDVRRAVGARRGEHRDMDRRAARRSARTRRGPGVGAALLDGGGRSQPAARDAQVPPQHSARDRARRGVRRLRDERPAAAPPARRPAAPRRAALVRHGVDEVAHARARSRHRVGQSLHGARLPLRGRKSRGSDAREVAHHRAARRRASERRYHARDRRRLDRHRDGRAGRDLERRRSDLAAGTLHERARGRAPGACGKPTSASARPASSACARGRPTRPGTRSPSAPLPIRPAMATTRSTRYASMRAEAPTWRAAPPRRARSHRRFSRRRSSQAVAPPASAGRSIRIRHEGGRPPRRKPPRSPRCPTAPGRRSSPSDA